MFMESDHSLDVSGSIQTSAPLLASNWKEPLTQIELQKEEKPVEKPPIERITADFQIRRATLADINVIT